MKPITRTMPTLAICLGVLLTVAAGSLAAKEKAPANQWYMKMTVIVQDGARAYWDDRSGVFGRLNGASVESDLHDVPVIQAAETTQVAIAFDVQGSTEHSQYLSDYRPTFGMSRQTWDFTVHTKVTNGQVMLLWEGLYQVSGRPGSFKAKLDRTNPVLRQLSLLDQETGEVIPAVQDGQLGFHLFDMNGKSKRHFRWVQQRVLQEDFVIAPPEVPGIKAQAERATGPLEATDSRPPVVFRPYDAPAAVAAPPREGPRAEQQER